jgi:hypothetical protein
MFSNFSYERLSEQISNVSLINEKAVNICFWIKLKYLGFFDVFEIQRWFFYCYISTIIKMFSWKMKKTAFWWENV